jgi:hypothetical protein
MVLPTKPRPASGPEAVAHTPDSQMGRDEKQLEREMHLLTRQLDRDRNARTHRCASGKD